jgi:outer membrane protein OmpA-like peptidoglycan-associated protein
LIAQDQAGNPLKTDALKITVNSTPPELTLRGEDDLFDFNTKKDFHFTLGAADRVGFQDWKLDVRGEDGKSVTIFDGAGSPPREVVWNGNGIEPGSILSAVFSATDNAGNPAATKPFNVQIDYQPVESGEQMTLNLTTVYFPVVSTDLGEDGRKEIKKAAASIQPYLNKSVLVVKGYASPLEAGDPLVLSRNRAQEVKKFLVKTLNLPPDSVFAVGYGTRASSKGAADNASGESQRRAVITLTTKP